MKFLIFVILLSVLVGVFLEKFVSFIELSGFSREEAFAIVVLSPLAWVLVPPIPFGEVNSLEIFLSPAGFIIPFLISLRQIVTKNVSIKKAFLGIILLSFLCNYFSNPNPNGVGITNPYIPIFSASLYSLAIEREKIAPLAYITATIGMFIGADILNLPKLNGVVVGYVTIGGAGIFDAIYLTGVTALIIDLLIIYIRNKFQSG